MNVQVIPPVQDNASPENFQIIESPDTSKKFLSSSPNVSNLVSNEDNEDNAFKQTPKSRKINRYRTTISRLKKRLFSEKHSASEQSKFQLLKALKKHVRPALYNILEAQLRNSGATNGRRWSASDKAFAFSIYIRSPAAYKSLKRFLVLPTQRTLRRSVQGVCQATGFCPEVFDVLREKVNQMDDDERQCILSFDEMSIRPSLQYNAKTDYVHGYQDEISVCDNHNIKIATHTLVFMARGIHENWKQILGYFLVHKSMPGQSLKPIVISCIEKLQAIGLDVLATVCDQASNNISLFNELGLTPEKTFFEVDNHDVNFMFDPPHLLKALRNNFLKYKLEYKRENFGTVTADWKYIYDFFEIDKGIEPRVAPKLTKNHVNPVGRSKMKVKLASQALSTSVAAGISLLKSVGKFDEAATHTAFFISMIDKLFDSFNSKKICDKKKLLCSVKKDSDHINFWNDMLKFIESWEFKNKNGEVVHTHCKKGWLITIKSAINICNTILKKHDNVFMRRFNQDALENTFSIIRSKRGNDCNPDCSQLASCLRTIMVNNIFNSSKASNCEADFDKVLLSLKGRSVSKSPKIDQIFQENAVITSETYDIDTSTFTVPEIPNNPVAENIEYYVAGYIGRKVIEKLQNCKECTNTLLTISDNIGDDHANEALSLLTNFKQYPGARLKRPTTDLFNIVKEMYRIDLSRIFWSKNVLKNMVMLFQRVVNFNRLKVHDAHKEIVQKILFILFAKIQIYSHIRKINNEIKLEFYSKNLKK